MHDNDNAVVFGIPFENLNQDDLDFLDDLFSIGDQGDQKVLDDDHTYSSFSQELELIIPYSISDGNLETAMVGFIIQGFDNFSPTGLDIKSINDFILIHTEPAMYILDQFLESLPDTITEKAGGTDLMVFMHNDD